MLISKKQVNSCNFRERDENKIMKKLSVLKFLLIIIVMGLFLFDSSKAGELMQPGEELLYEVSFLGVKLGSIKMRTEKKRKLSTISILTKQKALINTYIRYTICGYSCCLSKLDG